MGLAGHPIAGAPFTEVDDLLEYTVEQDRPDSCPDADDPIAPARGVLLAVLLCVPFWVALFWALL
jgi:hypothetical protein